MTNTFRCGRCGVHLVEGADHPDRECAENLTAILRDVREQLRLVRAELAQKAREGQGG